ncbi:MAG: PhzF family phenazine biosynthesis protein [Bacteroidota bacterium]
MSKIKLYQIDAFTDKVFGGNPAAVCVLNAWLDEATMQSIANENNLSETAFIVKKDDNYEIRWFTPSVEVDLCGHATLGSAYVLFKYYDITTNIIEFHSKASGVLPVEKVGDDLTLDFPTDVCEKVAIPYSLISAFNIEPKETLKGKTDYLLIYSNQKEIEELTPDFNLIKASGIRGVIVSAPGDKTDFVSRFFGPGVGVNEDPVTGSAHTTLTPYWSNRLGKDVMTARQLSKRGGDLKCEYLGDRVKITGKAIIYFIGEIEV